jgi:hypothetical protein
MEGHAEAREMLIDGEFVGEVNGTIPVENPGNGLFSPR